MHRLRIRGASSVTALVPTDEDDAITGDRTFTATPSGPTAPAVLGSASTATGTVGDDDTPPATTTPEAPAEPAVEPPTPTIEAGRVAATLTVRVERTGLPAAVRTLRFTLRVPR